MLSKEFEGVSPKWGDIGEIVYLRTYSRWIGNRREHWNETVGRVVDWSASLTPNVSDEEKESLYKTWFDLQAFPAGRSLWVGGSEYSKQYGFGQFNCFSKETKFVTKQGVKAFADFNSGDTVSVLSKGGIWREATVRSFGTQTLKRVIFRRGYETREVYATANHRWIVNGSDIKTTDSLSIGDEIESVTFRSKFAKANWRVADVLDTDRVEEVWCVQEPVTETFTLEGGILTMNCSFTDIVEPRDFGELAYLLMNGAGVGFSIVSDNIAKLKANHELISNKPVVEIKEYQYVGKPSVITDTVIEKDGSTMRIIIGDSREGWSYAIESYIQAVTGGHGDVSKIQINVDYVRPLGSRLGTFGGFASGPQPLIDLFTDATRVLFADNRGWTSVKVLDVCNMVGRTIVAGGSRRSAQIALGDADDQEYIEAKTGNWFETAPWRSQSNNTIVFKEKPTRERLKEAFEYILQYGEPGIMNMKAAQARRPDARGLNPCAEIILSNKGLCNLTTINLMSFIRGTKQIDWNALERAIVLQARHNLRVTNVDIELEHWDEVQKRDRLLGMSFTGFGDLIDTLGLSMRQQRKLLKWMAETSREAANDYADELGIPRPVLATAVKPEGSVTQLPGVSSGVHPNYGPFFIRRVRISESDAIAQALKEQGFRHEQDLFNTNTAVFEFPIKTPARKYAHEYTAIEMLERYKLTMKYYVEHNCSITVYLDESEVDGVTDWLLENWDSYVAVSFLPKNDEVYPQMPYEGITEETYDKLAKETPVFDRKILDGIESEDTSTEIIDNECAGGACPIR